MRSSTWRSDNGHIIHFGTQPTGAYIHGDIEGNHVSGRIQSDSPPGWNGQNTYGATLSGRSIILTGTIQGIGNKNRSAQAVYDEVINRLCFAFDPRYEGLLTFHLEEKDVAIRCRPVAIPQPKKRFEGLPIAEFSVDFIADLPHWHEAKERYVMLGVLRNDMRFPLFLNVNGGSPAGLIYNLLNANNPTLQPIFPIVEVFGSTELVRVDNTTTGRHIEVNRPVGANQKMVIDTRKYRVELYQMDTQGAYQFAENVSHWITEDSTDGWPFTLVPGENLLKINDEVAASTPVSVVRYHVPIMGVTF